MSRAPVLGPQTLDIGGDDVVKQRAVFGRLCTESVENAIDLVHIDAELLHFALLRIEIGVRRGNEQAEHQCSDGRDQSQHEFQEFL